MSLDLLAVFFGGAVALLPIFATDILHVGASGLGWLRAAPAIGAGLMSVWLAHQGRTATAAWCCSPRSRCSASRPSASAWRPRRGSRS